MKGLSTGLFALLVSLMTLNCHAALLESAAGPLFELAVSPVLANRGTTFKLVEPEDSSAGAFLARGFERTPGKETIAQVLGAKLNSDLVNQRSLRLAGLGDVRRGSSRVASVPEPSVVLLLVTGLVGLVLSRRRGRG